MQEKNNLVTIVLKKVLYLILLVSSSLILNTLFNSKGIVIDRDQNKELIYGSHNLLFAKISVIISIIIILALIIYESIKLFRVIKNEELIENNFIKITKIILLSVFIAVNIYSIIIFPSKLDKYNKYGFGFSFANLIIGITALLFLIHKHYFSEEKEKITIEVIAEGAIFAALAVVLSLMSKLIPFLELPQGGSFSLSMLPLFIYGFRRGISAGAIMGFVYGLVNFITDGFIIHWGSLFFDYLIPFSLVAASAGLFMNGAKKSSYKHIVLGVLLGGLLRYIMHGFSGVIFFGEFTEGNSWFYSFILYNLPYMAVSTIGSLIFTLILAKNFIFDSTKIR